MDYNEFDFEKMDEIKETVGVDYTRIEYTINDFRFRIEFEVETQETSLYQLFQGSRRKIEKYSNAILFRRLAELKLKIIEYEYQKNRKN